ncbi:thioredoxin fold domain-containing protein [Acidithiobacillus sp.]|jgi:thiol:disulfide interchange protein DsbG|uniref:thioredoxin fold domain-containing protein n=1 Tax=Acidithiobacillus sp. TaxID=1872118 RepID=UPI00261255C2|nr:thioredoxin fold domain-containing protein [Acidithiobacillus sp.]
METEDQGNKTKGRIGFRKATGLSLAALLFGPLLLAGCATSPSPKPDEHLAQPRKTPVEPIAPAVMKAPGFMIGHAGPLIVVFMDPNCIYCHLLWDALQKPVANGQLRAKIIPVGFLKNSSVAKAATILAANDRAAAWANNEKGFNDNTEEGGTRPLAHVPSKDIAAINTNTALLQTSGEEATPTLLFCQKHSSDTNATEDETSPRITVEHGIAMHALPALIDSLDGNVSAAGCTP